MPSSAKKKQGSRRGRAAHPSDLKPNGKRRNFLWRWRRGIFLAGLLFTALVAGVGYSLAQIELPPERIQAQTSFICAADVTSNCNDSNAIASLHGEQDRVNVTYEQLPPVVIDAVLGAEDRSFFEHGGVDPVGTLRALWADLRSSGSTQGGSTITQQYVKNVYLSSERTLTRKIKEAVLSIKVEQELSKQEILTRYLNTVYFGRGAYGIGSAVRTYFGHDLSQTTLPEAAYLAGLIRSPETADAALPNQVATATQRRQSVLQAMLEMRRITQPDYDAANAVPFVVGQTILPRPTERQGFGPVKDADIGTEFFRDYVVQQLKAAGYSEAELFGGGLRIYTTLDLDMQRKAYLAVTTTLTSDDDPLASVVSLDPDNHVKAMIGGRNYALDQVNIAVPGGGGSGRQPGSSFKPFVLAEALKQGISLKTQFNAPTKIVIPKADGGKDWTVNNAEPSDGVFDLIDATKHSSNTVFAQLMDKVRPENVVPLATQMGITTDLPPVDALVLGAGEVFPIDMASAYSTFAHRGTHIKPSAIIKVERPDGTVRVFEQPRTQPVSQQESDEVTFCLQQVVKGGTGTGASFGKPIAGKTGTTDKNKDAWFVGYTPNGWTTAVWMGYRNGPDDGPTRFMNNVHGRVVFGGTFPATIWNKYMKSITDGMDVGDFVNPTTFPGKVLNEDLTTTLSTDTTLPESSTTDTTVPGSTTETTKPPKDSTTTSTTAATTTTTTVAPGSPPPN